MSFTRNIEDFTCDRCEARVRGNGYTNHCPHCLWSRHVDNTPGDRGSLCGGMMRPIAIEGSSPRYVIIHQCLACGVRRRISVAHNDNADALIAIGAAHGWVFPSKRP